MEVCSDENMWPEVLRSWQINEKYPELFVKLVKQSVPETLRGQVWQRLCYRDDLEEIINNYKLLVAKVLHDFLKFFFPKRKNKLLMCRLG